MLRVFLEPATIPGTKATSAKICCFDDGLLVSSIEVSTAFEIAICRETVLSLGDLSFVVAKFFRENPTWDYVLLNVRSVPYFFYLLWDAVSVFLPSVLEICEFVWLEDPFSF